MARHYYLTRSGRLRRKDNTLCFEPSSKDSQGADRDAGDDEEARASEEALAAAELGAVEGEGMGDLMLEPEAESEDGGAKDEASEEVEETSAPVRVGERRTIPVEDVDALWVFGEVELNARVLVFLARHRAPVHFFNYYGFYAGTFYPREYLHAGYLVVRHPELTRALEIADAVGTDLQLYAG